MKAYKNDEIRLQKVKANQPRINFKDFINDKSALPDKCNEI